MKMQDLSVTEALQTILDSVSPLDIEQVPLLDSLQRVIAEPVRSQTDLPPFANSSMDGYAVVAEDTANASADQPVELSVMADIAAGISIVPELAKGTTARITTGAPMPPGADAVVPVEYSSEPWRDRNRPLPDRVKIYRAANYGDYVRLPGEDVKTGQIVITEGTRIRPQEIGMLASLGNVRVAVYRQPRIGILATGDELVAIDKPLGPGQIRNSNSFAQAAQVSTINAIPVILGVAKDSEESVRAHLQSGIREKVDIFITSAGVSVGAYDHVKAVLETHGDVQFWRVRMRPGKPLAFGTYEGIPLIGLPGNPVSAMVSFERFARPSILKMSGHRSLERPILTVKMLGGFHSDGRESYIRSIVSRAEDVYEARITGHQGSHIQSSLTSANALVIVPEGVKEVKSGDMLKAMMIDWPSTIF